MEYICYNNACYALAVFSNFKGDPTLVGELVINALAVIEFAFMIFLALFLAAVAVIVGQSSVFHRNMMRISGFLILHLYFYMITRIVLYMYQIRVISLPVDQLGAIGITIVSMSIIRCYVAYAVAFLLLAFVIERLFATILVHNYESHSRSWISTSIFVCITTSGMALSLDTTFKALLPPGANLVLVVFVCVLAEATALALYFYNRKRLELIITHRTQYTLPERYQLEENMRAFKFLMTLAVPGAFFIGLLFALLLVRIFMKDVPSQRTLYLILGAMYDTGVAIFLAIWGSIVFFFQPTWRESFLEESFRLFNIKRDRAPMIAKRDTSNDSEKYFNHLRSAWA